jgi:hypothetical protein
MLINIHSQYDKLAGRPELAYGYSGFIATYCLSTNNVLLLFALAVTLPLDDRGG